MNLNDNVKILPFDIKGVIIGIYLSNAPTEFRVRYFMDSSIKEEYFHGNELELCTK